MFLLLLVRHEPDMGDDSMVPSIPDDEGLISLKEEASAVSMFYTL